MPLLGHGTSVCGYLNSLGVLLRVEQAGYLVGGQASGHEIGAPKDHIQHGILPMMNSGIPVLVSIRARM